MVYKVTAVITASKVMLQDTTYGIRVWLKKKAVRKYDCKILEKEIDVDEDVWLPEDGNTSQPISEDGMNFLIRRIK